MATSASCFLQKNAGGCSWTDSCWFCASLSTTVAGDVQEVLQPFPTPCPNDVREGYGVRTWTLVFPACSEN